MCWRTSGLFIGQLNCYLLSSPLAFGWVGSAGSEQIWFQYVCSQFLLFLGFISKFLRNLLKRDDLFYSSSVVHVSEKYFFLFFSRTRRRTAHHYIKKKREGVIPPKSYSWKGAVTPWKYCFYTTGFFRIYECDASVFFS